MRTLKDRLILVICMLLCLGTVALQGCGEDDDSSEDTFNSDATSTDASGTPIVPAGEVAMADFCPLMDQIGCSAHTNCCSTPSFTDIDTCVAASNCSDAFGALLASPLLADGTVVYDAAIAGEFLRAKEAAGANCGADSGDIFGEPFLVGTLAEGGDCQLDDPAAGYACAPGLRCMALPESDESVDGTVCTAFAEPAMSGLHGATCIEDEDCMGACLDGACAADPEMLYCDQDFIPAPPANGSFDGTIDHLYLKVSGSNSGSSNDIVLSYYDGSGTRYYCTINGISSNSTETCTPSTSSSSKSRRIYITNDSNDGLNVDTACARDSSNNEQECFGSFDDSFDGSNSCSGWDNFWAGTCSKVWIDLNSNGDCGKIRVKDDSGNTTTCSPL